MVYLAKLAAQELKELFEQSNLPEQVDETFCHELILKLRKINTDGKNTNL
jgi:hypothetical protein